MLYILFWIFLFIYSISFHIIWFNLIFIWTLVLILLIVICFFFLIEICFIYQTRFSFFWLLFILFEINYKIEFFLNFILLYFFYLLDLVFILLIVTCFIWSNLWNWIFFQFHHSSSFLSVIFSHYSFNRLEKIIKILISYFSTHFSSHSQILKSVFQFIFNNTVKY